MTLREAMKNYDKARRAYWKNDSKLKNSYVMMDDCGDFVDERNEYVVFNPTFLWDDWEEYKYEILDEKEREYLRAVIKPFRDRIRYVEKLETYWVDEGEYLIIRYDDEGSHDIFSLPWFAKGSMYKEMELGKEYTLKELGL